VTYLTSRMSRLRVLAFVTAALVIAAIPSGVSALTASKQARTNDQTVTLTLRVNYNLGQCSDGQTTIDIIGVTTQFTRTAGSGRKVPTSHLAATGWSRTCSGDSVTPSAKGSWNPVFGCSRCSQNSTEALGMSVSFPPVRDLFSCLWCSVGGSGDGHAKTSSGAALSPNPVCARQVLNSLAPPCPDNFTP
jgi:hypothetical protein